MSSWTTKILLLISLSYLLTPSSLVCAQTADFVSINYIDTQADSPERLDQFISEMSALTSKNITKFASSNGFLPDISISGGMCVACCCPCFIPCIVEGCVCEIFSTPSGRLKRMKYHIRAQFTDIRNAILSFPTLFPETYHESYSRNVNAYNSLVEGHSQTKSGGMRCMQKRLFEDSVDVKNFKILEEPAESARAS